jgi:hypothetical protein
MSGVLGMEVQFFLGTLLVGILFGFVLQRGRFCMVSAFRDPLVAKEYNLLKAVAIAFAVQMIGFLILVGVGAIPSLSPKPFVPWANIVGGLIFGVGASFAGGCASGTTYRIGEGMVGSFVAAGGLAIFGVATTAGIFSTAKVELNSYSVPGVGGDLTGGSSSLTLANLIGPDTIIHIVIVIILVAVIGVLVWWHTTKKSDYKLEKPDDIVDSIFKKGWNFWVTGIAIGVVGIIAFAVNFWAGKKYPLGITGGWNNALQIFTQSVNSNWFTWIVVGVIIGAAIAALIAGEFKWRSPGAKTLLKQFLGGGAMGVGAAIAGGCNIGHGLSGVPMLSIGSIVTLGCIILGIWVTSYFLFMRD